MKCKHCGIDSDKVLVRIIRVTEYELDTKRRSYQTKGKINEQLGEPIYLCKCGYPFGAEVIQKLDSIWHNN